MDSSKFQLAQAVQKAATTLAQLERDLQEISMVYNKRGFGPGLPGAITDEELVLLQAQLGRILTADDIYAMIITADQFKTFLDNGVPAQRDYLSTIQKLRTDI